MSMVVKPVLHVPAYEAEAANIGVVHIGFGAFHRAHQALYLDRYMEQSGDLRWGVAAVNLRAADSDAFEDAKDNDGYVLKTMSTGGETEYRLIRCHRLFVDWTKATEDAEILVARPSVKMITITVTESGYALTNDGALNAEDPAIAREISDGAGVTIYAYLRASLTLRMNSEAGAISILCCDNLRGNGHLLSQNFKTYLRLCGDEKLLGWIDDNVTFPASMVDRITPKPTPALQLETEQYFGRQQDKTVLGEDFIQWVIEDDFAAERPELEKVGVTITGDIDPYEETKIRVLNGGHTCLTYLGALAGYTSYDDAIHDPDLFDHYWSYETKEVIPALTIDVPFSKTDYLDTVTTRFKNRHISDSIERICADGFAKFPIFILPTLKGCLALGIKPVFAYRSVASWYVYAKRVISGQLAVHYIEPNLEALRPLIADDAKEAFVTSKTLWGEMAESYPNFKNDLISAIDEMEKSWPMSA